MLGLRVKISFSIRFASNFFRPQLPGHMFYVEKVLCFHSFSCIFIPFAPLMLSALPFLLVIGSIVVACHGHAFYHCGNMLLLLELQRPCLVQNSLFVVFSLLSCRHLLFNAWPSSMHSVDTLEARFTLQHFCPGSRAGCTVKGRFRLYSIVSLTSLLSAHDRVVAGSRVRSGR